MEILAPTMHRLFYGLILLFLASCVAHKTSIKQKSSIYFKHFHEGVRYQLTGDYQKAIYSFEKSLDEEPKDDAAAFGIALCLEKQNQSGAAISFMEKASKADQKNSYYIHKLAGLYQATGEFSKAAKMQESLINSLPSEQLYFDAAMNYASAKEVKKALKILDKLSEKFGNTPELVLYRYNILLNANPNSEKGIDLLEKANLDFPNEPGILSYLIDHHMSRGNYRKGSELLEKLVLADPTNALANLLLGDVYLESGKKREAYSYYKKAVMGEGLSAKTIVETFIKMKDVWITDNEILPLLNECQLAFPNEPLIYSLIGDFYFMKNDTLRTIEYYKNAVLLNPDLSAIWNELLLLEYELEDWTSLKQDGKNVLELYPLSPIGFYMTGTAMNRLAEFKEATSVLEDGLFLIVNDNQLTGEFKAQLAESAIGNSEPIKGISLFEEALTLSPENIYILSRYFNSSIFKLKDLKKANELLMSLKKIEGNENRKYEWTALLNFAEKKYTEALNNLNQVGASYSQYKNVSELQGDILFFQNKKEEALEKWKQAKEMGKNSPILELKISTKKYHDPL